MLNPVEVIRHKRNGKKLSSNEIASFISGAVEGSIPDYQVSALLMALFFKGMDIDEVTSLTKSMIESGTQVKFSDEKPKIDKHSTGGVGDKVSPILAPLVASLGVDVPMIAGRGLGHTAGTLDKLESIPGYQVNLSTKDFVENIKKHGLAIMSQTRDLVPADKLLYALRDVTATIECIPLITASILSKKSAEGISGLVQDVKVGSGAFLKTQKDAERLSRNMLSVGKQLGLKVRCVLTDMNQPLGYAIGHSLEIIECVNVLRGKGPTDLKEVTIELAAHMLVLGEKSSSLSAARTMARKALQNGTALKRFKEQCYAQGATVDITEEPSPLKVSEKTFQVVASKAGYVSKINGETLGFLLVDMGGGRHKVTDKVDHSVGFVLHKKIGAKVTKGQPLMTVYYGSKLKKEEIYERAESAYAISLKKTAAPKLLKKVVM